MFELERLFGRGSFEGLLACVYYFTPDILGAVFHHMNPHLLAKPDLPVICVPKEVLDAFLRPVMIEVPENNATLKRIELFSQNLPQQARPDLGAQFQGIVIANACP